MWFVLLGLAGAGELNFSPDRPGVGNSGGTVGTGSVMVEGGLAATVTQPAAVGTSSLIGRFGVDDGVEVRVRAPDFVLVDGQVATGFAGMGAKVGAQLNERWSASVVPELAVDVEDGSVFGLLNGQLGFTYESVTLWGTAETAVAEFGSDTTAGGGVAVAISGGGIYGNAGGQFAGDPFVGGGGWWALKEAVQLDIGCDVYLGGEAVPVFLLGGSVGF